MTTTEIQRALQQLGYAPGPVDGIAGNKTRDAIIAFQKDHYLTADGIAGPKTQAALNKALQLGAQPAKDGAIVPSPWLPNVKMKGIVFHWTAGQHTASTFDKLHYHILIEGSGKVVRGMRSIAANVPPLVPNQYAAHTRNHNSNIIGVSLCAMAGAKEKPFIPGKAPITAEQWSLLPRVLADLCRTYKIEPTRQNVLSHAEVERTLQIFQAQKWDISWKPGMDKPGDAIAIGDEVRAAVAKLI